MKSNLFSRFKLIPVLLFAVSVTACRKDKNDGPSSQQLSSQGIFILNEGNWNHNNSTLDYYDYQSQKMNNNVYSNANEGAALGDVGQDVQVYGSKIYIVVNGSNSVEIADVNSLKSIKNITVEQPRAITFNKAKAFVSSYDDHVYVIDTATMQIEKSIAVGRDPEHLAVVGNKLYVANSGGLDAEYDNTISVVDLHTLEEIKEITVDINLNQIVADQYGDLYVISQGRDWGDYIPSALYVIDTKTETVKKKFDITASGIAISGDNGYVYSYSYTTQQISYIKLNVKDETITSDNFISDGIDASIQMPYGIAADPTSGDVYIADAKDFQNQGEVFCFDKNGKKKFSVAAGVGPAHLAFYSK